MKNNKTFEDKLEKAKSAVYNIQFLSNLMRYNISVEEIKEKNGLSYPFIVKFSKKNDSPINLMKISFNQDKKLNENQILFTILVLTFFCAYGFTNNLEDKKRDIEYSEFLFCFIYVYKNFNLKDVPYYWLPIEKICLTLNSKSPESIHSLIVDDKYIMQTLKESPMFLLRPEVKVLTKVISTRVITFEESFTQGLVESVQKKIEKNAIVKKIDTGLDPIQERFFNKYPFFSSMVSIFTLEKKLEECRRLDIDYGCIDFNQKKIYINEFILKNESNIDFIFAHEMLHAALKHDKRRKNREPLMWNLACDFVINNWLVEMKVGLPPDGVYLDAKLSKLSAEEIYEIILRDRDLLKEMMTMRTHNAGHKYNKHKDKNAHLDMFGDEQVDDKQFGDLSDAAARAMLQGYHIHKNLGRGSLPLGLEEEIRILSQPSIPWQVELATWLARFFPQEQKVRTYAKASRRTSITPDIPLAGYKKPKLSQNTRTFGVIMDTSGSMSPTLLGKCLGAISAYAKQHNVEQVRIIYCDTEPYDVGYISVDNLKNKMKVVGRGGTYLQIAVNYLELQNDFPAKAPILVLSDGYFEETLTIKREHAFLVPDKFLLRDRKNVFEFK
jgi:hypothetical protein